MSDSKISALTALAAANIATGDELVLVDVSAGDNKYTTFADLSARTETMTNKTLTSPVLTTPNIGVATATSVNGSLVPTTSADTLVGKATTDTLTNKTLTSPTITTPTINQINASSNTSIKLNAGTYGAIQTYTPSGGGTATLDLSLGNIHHITMPAGNITIALSNGTAGQCFIIRILQDSVGSRTVTWFTTIKWTGGSAPTLTTTASKADTVGFEITGSATYDGFLVGANI